jgi:hypothetical protein
MFILRMAFKMLKAYGMILRSESRPAPSAAENSLWNSGFTCGKSVGALGASLVPLSCTPVLLAGIIGSPHRILRIKKFNLAFLCGPGRN